MDIVNIFNSFAYPVAVSVVLMIAIAYLVKKFLEKTIAGQEKLTDALQNLNEKAISVNAENTTALKNVSEALLQFSKSNADFASALLEFSKKIEVITMPPNDKAK